MSWVENSQELWVVVLLNHLIGPTMFNCMADPHTLHISATRASLALFGFQAIQFGIGIGIMIRI